MSCVWVSAVLKQFYVLGMVMKMCTCTSERTCRTWLILFRLDLAAAPGGQASDVRGVLQRGAAAHGASRRTVDVRRLVSRVSAHARVCRLVSRVSAHARVCRLVSRVSAHAPNVAGTVGGKLTFAFATSSSF